MDQVLLGSSSMSTLDAPRRLVDLDTGLPSLTSLFSDLQPIVNSPDGFTVIYIHIPSSAIVEERFGWELLGAYRDLIATYLTGFSKDLLRGQAPPVLIRAYADDFVLIMPRSEEDRQIPTSLADGMTRHLAAIDVETASLLQVYIGMAQGRKFPKIHPERHMYRIIQAAQTEATDVGRQRLSAQTRSLDRSISERSFKMLYQPIVRVEDHSIFAFEALVRCLHKDLKNPHVLFNVAEQSDKIWPLSRLLRKMAADEIPMLPDETLMFINLHPLDFDDPTLLDPDTGIIQCAEKVVLEVTERAAILDLERFQRQLATLREMGARIAVDDLGSGYSSLSLVADLKPDFIKIDMTLIKDIHLSLVRQNLLRNIVSFATDLGAEVVAEGVETREELNMVRSLGCQLIQGFYLAMPSPPFIKTIMEKPTENLDFG